MITRHGPQYPAHTARAGPKIENSRPRIPALFEAGLYCRADDRAEPVVQLSPPLISEQRHFDEMEQILREVLTEVWKKL